VQAYSREGKWERREEERGYCSLYPFTKIFKRTASICQKMLWFSGFWADGTVDQVFNRNVDKNAAFGLP